MSDIYREVIIDHYKHPRNVGKLSDADVHGHEDNTVCGDTIDFYIKYDAEGNVVDVHWTGEGCALSQASASLLSEMVQGKTKYEIARIQESDILKVVGENLNPSRQKCATLSIYALRKGLTD